MVAVIASAVACGSTASDSGAGADAGGQPDAATAVDAASDTAGCSLEPDLSGNAEAFAEAACAPHADCCTQIGLGFDTTACVQDLAPRYQKEIDSARCRGAQYDASGVADCIAALKAYSESCPMNYGNGDLGELFELSKQACARVLDGKQQPGDPCDSHFDCVQTEGTMTECAGGVCRRTIYGQDGASCDPFAEPIQTECNKYEGLVCKNDECEPLSAIGESCASPFHCVPEAYCDLGTCQPRKALGEACNDDCLPLLTCVNGTCGGKLGDPCTAASECASYECTSGKCAPRNHLVTFLAGMTCN